MKLRNLFLLIALSLPVCLSAQTSKQIYLQRADSLLQQILTLYKVEKYGLLTETYPRNPEQRITYTANTGAVVNQQEVSFLWPYSALVSGCVSLYKVSGQKKYRKLMDRQIKPGLDLYWDSTRIPHCYQSYPAFAGPSVFCTSFARKPYTKKHNRIPRLNKATRKRPPAG